MAFNIAADPSGSTSLHATALSLDGRALLLCGGAGAGKSRTAAQLMALGAKLIVDDLVVLSNAGRHVHAAAPKGRRVQIELRGIGIVDVPEVAGPSPVHAVCYLDPDARPERLPEPQVATLLGHEVAMLTLPFAEDLGARLWLWVNGLK